jgi:hypothetical protein
MIDPHDIARLMQPVATMLLGTPNAKLSSKHELRYGTRGSMAIDLKKGVWHDHERGVGGGVLDFIHDQTGLDDRDAWGWIEEHGLQIERAQTAPRPNGKGRAKPKLGQIVACYPYVDENGVLLYQVVRYANPKDFRQRPPDGRGGWIDNIVGVKRVPYRLPEPIEAIALGHTVVVVDCEADVGSLVGLGGSRHATAAALAIGVAATSTNIFATPMSS